MWPYVLLRPAVLPSPKWLFTTTAETCGKGGPGQNSIDVYDALVYNGTHNIVVKAWDSYGNVYQAKETFHVTGLGFPFCSNPRSRESTSACLTPLQFSPPTPSSSRRLKAQLQ